MINLSKMERIGQLKGEVDFKTFFADSDAEYVVVT